MPARSFPTASEGRTHRLNRQALLFGALALVAVALFSVLVPVHVTLYLQPAPFAFLFGAMLCAAPLVAVRFPRWSIVLSTVAAVVLPLPTGEAATTWPWPWTVPAMLVLILFVSVLAILHGWRIALAGWLPAIAGTLAVVIALSAEMPAVAGVVNLVIVTSVSGAALLIAVLVASRLRVGAELTRERELTALEQSRRVLGEERTRIARELHDVVAHGMSLIQVQASTARYRVPGLSDEALHEFDEIAQAARAGLTEMRRLLGVLRTEGEQTLLAPQQGLRDIPELVQALQRAGAEIDATLIPSPEGVSGAVDITAFRITQEALSNAVRHAPQARIELTTQADAATLRILVRNGPPQTAPPPGDPAQPGHGILGMRERAALVGGTVTSERDTDGGWTTRATLPLAPPPPDPTPGGAA